MFEAAGVATVAPMFDGCIVRPLAAREDVNANRVISGMGGKITVVNTPWPDPGFGAQVRRRLRTLRTWLSWVPGPGNDNPGRGP